MKRTDLEKNRGLKINSSANRFGTPGRFGKDAAAPMQRREQRKLEQSLGLVPFAVKLDGELVKQIQALAQTRQTGLNEVVAELLKKGLDSQTKAKA
ncbi:MAG: hypothetical protein MUP61_02075 [Burkholderiales bacterium]|nr:hypothetical protein [Burkholderiales bacterium]MCJ7837989.1 hypothetical protein [Burkholderiales bacterium]